MIISRFNPLLLSFAILNVNAGLQWFNDFGLGGQVKVQSSSGYNWDALVSDSESKPLPSFLPGHPKKRGGEIGCIQIPSLAGVHGPCSSTENSLPNRQAGLIAVSMDSALLAVCEKRGSEIFIYDTKTLRLQHRLDSRYGMGLVVGMFFGAGSRLVVASIVGTVPPGRSFIRVFDLDRQSSHGIEAVKNRTLDAYKAALQESEHMPHAISPERLEEMVSTLIWETQLQGDLDEGWAYEGSFHNSRSACDPHRGLSIDGRYLISSYGGIISVVDILPDDSRPPQRLFSLPLDSQTHHRDIAMHFTNSSSQGQSLIATISPESEEDEERRLRIWSTVTGNIEYAFPIPKDIDRNSMSFTRSGPIFSPDGKLGISSLSFGGDYQLWHVENGTAFRSIKSDGRAAFDNSIAFSTDGEFVLVVSGGHITIYNTSTGDLIHDWVLRDLVDRATDYTLDSKVVARSSSIQTTQCAQNGMVICTLSDGSIGLFDPKTNREGWIPPSKSKEQDKSDSDGKTSLNSRSRASTVHIPLYVEVAMSPDGNTLYVADVDGNVRIWSL